MTARPIQLEIRVHTDLSEESLTNITLWNKFFSRLGIKRETYIESVKLKKPAQAFKTKKAT